MRHLRKVFGHFNVFWIKIKSHIDSKQACACRWQLSSSSPTLDMMLAFHSQDDRLVFLAFFLLVSMCFLFSDVCALHWRNDNLLRNHTNYDSWCEVQWWNPSESLRFSWKILGFRKNNLARKQEFSFKRNCPLKLSGVNKQQQLLSRSHFLKH